MGNVDAAPLARWSTSFLQEVVVASVVGGGSHVLAAVLPCACAKGCESEDRERACCEACADGIASGPYDERGGGPSRDCA